MLRVELIPDLSHCVETVARREHAAVSRQLLASTRSNRELEERLEVLKLFLETGDFRKLRAESERMLIEGKKVRFTVYRDKGMRCEMQVI